MKINRRTFLQAMTAAAATSALNQTLAASPTLEGKENSTESNSAKAKWTSQNFSKKPNIVIAVVDDVGFSDFGAYGSESDTPVFDRIAKEGSKFNNFHVTALCAPTRACLLTGRNAHSAGVGNIAEWGRDLPAYKGWINESTATLPEMLKTQGYANWAIGKWHLSSLDDQNASGPFARWPTGRGFDKWYGFHGNAMDHFHPELFENTVATYPEKGPDYHLTTDLIDNSIGYMKDHLSSSPEQPFFMYLAFGACHFPHHPPAEFALKNRGKYANGWDQTRQQRYQKQKVLGIVPESTLLSPRAEGVDAWETLTPEQRQVSERGQEVYSAFLEHTDYELGRLVDQLEQQNILDDTIIVVLSDNGAARSSQPFGTLDLRRSAYLDKESFQHLQDNLDNYGTEKSQCEYGPGWAQVGNTPLRWFKADTYGGGTRSPLAIRWPNGGIKADQIAQQYHHAIDLVPSLLEMINAAENDVIKRPEAPIEGTSFAYALQHPKSTSNKPIQYFETAGDRALWKGGWKAVVRHHAQDEFGDDDWELFHLDQDFSEMKNLADTHPEKLKELVRDWYVEAQKYGVLPMSSDLLDLYKKSVPPARANYNFYPDMTRLDRLSAPDIYHYNALLTFHLENAAESNGVLLASGDSSMGYEIWIDQGILKFCYVYTRERVTQMTASMPLKEEVNQVRLSFTHQNNKTHVLLTNNESQLAEATLTDMWAIYAPNSGIRCGENSGAPISYDYDGSNRFSGSIVSCKAKVDLSQKMRSS